MLKRSGPSAIAALSLLLSAGAPRPLAQEPAPGRAATGLALGNQDIMWISASILSAIPAQLSYRAMAPVDTAALDKDRELWAMDRWAVFPYSSGLSLASDAAVAAMMILPMAVSAWDARQGSQAWSDAFADAVIFGEAIALSSSLDLYVRSLAVHPRPQVYDGNAPASKRLSAEASGSFYSGHASAAFLSAVYFSGTYSLRHPDSRYRSWIRAGSLGAAAIVSGLRVAAGKHYPSDVLAGAAIGSFFGWVFPYLHRRDAPGSAEMGLRIDGNGPRPMITWRF